MNCSTCNAFHCNNVSECDACLAKHDAVVGFVHVAEPTEMRDSFESAAQYRTVRVNAGTHPIIVAKSRFDGRRYVVVRFSGIVTSAGYGAKSYPIGHEETLSKQPYKYELRSGSFWGHRVEIKDDAVLDMAHGV